MIKAVMPYIYFFFKSAPTACVEIYFFLNFSGFLAAKCLDSLSDTFRTFIHFLKRKMLHICKNQLSNVSLSKGQSNVKGQNDGEDIFEVRPLNFKVIVS